MGTIRFKNAKGLTVRKSADAPDISKVYFDMLLENIPVEALLVVNTEDNNVRTVEKKLNPTHSDIKQNIMESSFPLDLLHRPIVISAESMKKDGNDLLVDGIKLHDGGHSIQMVKEILSEKDVKKHMPFMLLHSESGKIPHKTMEAMIVAIQGGKQPKDKSSYNFSGKFDWLKTQFKGKGFENKISYQEGQEKKLFPVDVQHILTIIAIVAHDQIIAGEKKKHHVSHSYLQKTGLLERYKKTIKIFQSTSPILNDILELRDFIEESAIEFIGSAIKNKKFKNMAKAKGGKSKFISFFTNHDRSGMIYSGDLMPMIAPLAHFTTVNKNGDIVWRNGWNRNSIEEVYKKAIGSMVMETVELKTDATHVAKNTAHWSNLRKTIVDIADRMERNR